jgi:probable phosphoglycerate mutase
VEADLVNGTATLHLVRHAESGWNLERRYQGHGDSELTEAGVEHADALADWLVTWVGSDVQLVASDLRRARATALPLATLIDADVALDARFREIDVGTWSGRLIDEVAIEHPDIVAAVAAGNDVARGGGETYAQTRQRVVAAMDEVAGDGRAAHTLVFTHAGPIRVAAAAALGLPPPGHDRLGPPDHCSVSTFELIDGRWRLLHYNRTVPPTVRGAVP